MIKKELKQLFELIDSECFEGKLKVGESTDGNDYHIIIKVNAVDTAEITMAIPKKVIDPDPIGWYEKGGKLALQGMYKEVFRAVKKTEELLSQKPVEA
jgi:hypothetical protein